MRFLAETSKCWIASQNIRTWALFDLPERSVNGKTFPKMGKFFPREQTGTQYLFASPGVPSCRATRQRKSFPPHFPQRIFAPSSGVVMALSYTLFVTPTPPHSAVFLLKRRNTEPLCRCYDAPSTSELSAYRHLSHSSEWQMSVVLNETMSEFPPPRRFP